jgi:hypothetical protein
MLVSVFGVFLAATAATQAQTATVVSTTVRESLNFASHTCQAVEAVTFTGTQDTVYEVVNDGSGELKLVAHSNWENVLGTSASGRLFRGTNLSDETLDITSLPSEQTISVSQRWLGSGEDSPSMVYTLKYRITIASNGNVTSHKDRENVECRQ